MKALLTQLEQYSAYAGQDGDLEKVLAKLRERIRLMEGQNAH